MGRESRSRDGKFLRKNQMKLRKNEMISPKNFFIPPWRIQIFHGAFFSGVLIRKRGVTTIARNSRTFAVSLGRQIYRIDANDTTIQE